MSEKVIDINEFKNKKRRQICPKKYYQISGTLVCLLEQFTRFMNKPDKEKSSMEFYGYVNAIAKLVIDEKWEEVPELHSPEK